MKDCCDGGHPYHGDELKRLNRIAGQVEGVKKMIEERRYCPDIITQVKAIKSALVAVEANMLEKHLTYCVEEAFASNDKKEKQKKIQELKELFRKS